MKIFKNYLERRQGRCLECGRGLRCLGGIKMGNGTKGPPDTSLDLQGTRTNIRLILIPIRLLVSIFIILSEFVLMLILTLIFIL